MILKLMDPELIPHIKRYDDVQSSDIMPKRCYSFARSMIYDDPKDSDTAYIEGIAMRKNGLPIGHAWIRTEENIYLDGTDFGPDCIRCGIEIPQQVFRKYMSDDRFIKEYEIHNDILPFMRAYHDLYPSNSIAQEISSS